MYPIRALAWPVSCTKWWGNISTPSRKKLLFVGTKHGDCGFGEFFWWRSMSVHVHLRILRIYFLRYKENSYPGNVHQSNFPLAHSHLENSHPENSQVDVDGIFQGLIPSGVIFLEPFSSHNVSILIFQKIFSKYNKTLTKRYIL